MLQFARRKTGGGFNIVPNAHGGLQRLMRNKTAGYGMGREVLESMSSGKVKTPMQHLSQKQTHSSVRSTKPKKYISLNL